ncbi:MAG: hypothetical protein BKPUNTRY_002180 [Candidatus Fervidibacter sp.]
MFTFTRSIGFNPTPTFPLLMRPFLRLALGERGMEIGR